MTKSAYKLITPTIDKLKNFSSNNKIKFIKFASLFSQIKKKELDLFCWSSSCLLLPSHVDKRVAIHNGKLFSIFQLKKSMVLLRSGLLVRTKKLGSSIHLVKKKRKKVKK